MGKELPLEAILSGFPDVVHTLPFSGVDSAVSLSPSLIDIVEKSNWESDSKWNACSFCGAKFGIRTRRHHCRICGGVFCSNCCDENTAIMLHENVGPVCKLCTHSAKEKLSFDDLEELYKMDFLLHPNPRLIVIMLSLIRRGLKYAGTREKIQDSGVFKQIAWLLVHCIHFVEGPAGRARGAPAPPPPPLFRPKRLQGMRSPRHAGTVARHGAVVFLSPTHPVDFSQHIQILEEILGIVINFSAPAPADTSAFARVLLEKRAAELRSKRRLLFETRPAAELERCELTFGVFGRIVRLEVNHFDRELVRLLSILVGKPPEFHRVTVLCVWALRNMTVLPGFLRAREHEAATDEFAMKKKGDSLSSFFANILCAVMFRQFGKAEPDGANGSGGQGSAASLRARALAVQRAPRPSFPATLIALNRTSKLIFTSAQDLGRVAAGDTDYFLEVCLTTFANTFARGDAHVEDPLFVNLFEKLQIVFGDPAREASWERCAVVGVKLAARNATLLLSYLRRGLFRSTLAVCFAHQRGYRIHALAALRLLLFELDRSRESASATPHGAELELRGVLAGERAAAEEPWLHELRTLADDFDVLGTARATEEPQDSWKTLISPLTSSGVILQLMSWISGDNSVIAAEAVRFLLCLVRVAAKQLSCAISASTDLDAICTTALCSTQFHELEKVCSKICDELGLGAV
eukprot:gnl/Chilomastix_cuspidata/4016.p1 GENE.gnl/Chilomastix_cuspidata/4016~~gnl/Chilomastix_cuspidata/4016.p1  ORF type:complete len:693 (+),score=220.48 gnl/Chilomastix_cuspidata/4016:368-2446(+)